MSSPSRLEEVFLAALTRGTPQERAAYLDEACRDDAELRRRVDRLLQAHSQAGSFLEKPALEPAQTVAAADQGGLPAAQGEAAARVETIAATPPRTARRPEPKCVTSVIMNCWKRSRGAAWVSCTGRGR
jgi:hypothetical protein